MSATADRMRMMRVRRIARGVREVRVTTLDARSATVRAEIARQSAALSPADEEEAMRWIEAVSEFDEPDAR